MGHLLGNAGLLSHGVLFHLGSAKVCSPAVFETYISYDKDLCIAVTDYYMNFYLILLLLLLAKSFQKSFW